MWDFDKFGTNIALVSDEITVSYDELNKCGIELTGHIGRRCLVFLLCSNTVGSVVGYSTFVNNGIVPVLVNAHMESDLLENLINNYQPSYLWIPNDLKSNFDEFGDAIYDKYGYSLIESRSDSQYEIHEDLCLLLTTSGSTGSPKFVRQSYDNVKSNAESIVKYLKIDCTEKPITTLPINYTY